MKIINIFFGVIVFGWFKSEKKSFFLNGQELAREQLTKQLMGLIFLMSKRTNERIVEFIPESIIFSKSHDLRPFFFATTSFCAACVFNALSSYFNVSESKLNEVKELCREEFQKIKGPDGIYWSGEESSNFIQLSTRFQYLIQSDIPDTNSKSVSPSSYAVMLLDVLADIYQYQLADDLILQRSLLEFNLSIQPTIYGPTMREDGFDYR